MTADCSHCGAARVAMAVPAELTAYNDSDAVACCSSCLRVTPCEPPAQSPSFELIHDRFPTGDNGVAMVLLLAKLDSLALNRDAIESLAAILNTAGVDLFLLLDRLISAADVEPAIALSRRRDQLLDLL